MTSSFWLVEKGGSSQSYTHTVLEQYTVKIPPSGTVGDLVRAARGYIPEIKSSDVGIDNLDIQVYTVRRSWHSY